MVSLLSCSGENHTTSLNPAHGSPQPAVSFTAVPTGHPCWLGLCSSLVLAHSPRRIWQGCQPFPGPVPHGFGCREDAGPPAKHSPVRAVVSSRINIAYGGQKNSRAPDFPPLEGNTSAPSHKLSFLGCLRAP